MVSMPASRRTTEAFSNNARATSGSFTHSKKPKNPARSLWYLLCERLTIAAMRPMGLPRRSAMKAVIVPWCRWKVESGARNFAMLPGNGGVKTGSVL
jgi:hypothetical protein